jgi:hypothetical protein
MSHWNATEMTGSLDTVVRTIAWYSKARVHVVSINELQFIPAAGMNNVQVLTLNGLREEGTQLGKIKVTSLPSKFPNL